MPGVFVAKIYPSAVAALAAVAPSAMAPLTWSPHVHAVNRFGFGLTVADLGGTFDPDAWWSAQVAATVPGYGAVPAVAAIGPLLTQTPAQVRAWMKAQGNEYNWTAMDQLCQVTLGLQMFSPAQLYETAVDCFANHLNVANRSSDVWNTRHDFDRTVVRAHVFGSFKDMLLASAKHPAMLYYLNQAESNKTAVNENYGRELLELHTVGLNYTEDDVKNSAAILTGRTVNDADQTYIYKSTLHATGWVTVLGFTDPNATAAGGEGVGDNYLTYLARHPLTAQNIARKLCTHYVSDTPSDALVALVAAVYLANDTAILPTLYAIFCSDEFWTSRGAKTRRPCENLVSTVRILGLQPAAAMADAIDQVRWQIYSMANTPLECQTPNGYGDVAVRWRSAGNLITMWNAHRGLAQAWWNQWSKPDPTAYLNGVTPSTSSDAIDALSARIVGQQVTAADKQTLLTYLGDTATTAYAKSKVKSNLIGVVVLLLDSPYSALH